MGMGGHGPVGEGVTPDAAGDTIADQIGPTRGLTRCVRRLLPD